MADFEKVRIAYTGESLDNGAMDVNDLAPALIAFGNLVKRVNTIIGNKQSVRVLLKADDIRRGSFDITLLLDYSILEEARLFMGLAEDSGLKALMDILGMGALAKDSIFWLIQFIGLKEICKIDKDDDKVNIEFTDNSVINVTNNVYNVYKDHEARSLIEKVVAPIKKDGIQSFEIRNAKDYSDKNPSISIDKSVVDCFKTPELESSVETDNIFEQEMILKIVSIVFDENQKWRFSDGDVVFWAGIEDEAFWKSINDGVLAFRSGDRLKVRCKVVQHAGANESLTTKRIITKVIQVIPKPTQIKLNFGD